jgi:hypothetical protein
VPWQLVQRIHRDLVALPGGPELCQVLPLNQVWDVTLAAVLHWCPHKAAYYMAAMGTLYSKYLARAHRKTP